MTTPFRKPVPGREPSLIERAADVYDFGAHLRGRVAADAPVDTPLPTYVVERDAAAPVPYPREGGDPEPQAARWRPLNPRLRGDTAGRTDTPAADVAGADLEDRDPRRERTALEKLMDAQPRVFPEPAFVAMPAGVVSIDRVMLAQKGMLVPGAPVGALAEEFRLVKRALLSTAKVVQAGPLGDRSRTILVGSGKPGDGKTFCAINLAISLAAERDVEVVLVDGDFAKPDLMNTLGLEDSTGMLDILADHAIDPEACIVPTDVPQLSLLPAGKRSHSDTELLASARTGEVIDRLLAANPRRLLVFDTPPTLAASPASVLATLVGQVMLVVRADRTTEADVRESVALLDGCEHIQLVLNAVSYEPGRGRFGSYYRQEK